LVLIGRRVYGSIDAKPGLLPQSRAHAMIGADFFLDEPIVHGYGRIRVGDSSWRVAGADCPSGAMVRVVAVDNGSVLRVERIEPA
jgi:membrane protein implicated in regulation of membrane protease activity